MKRISLIQYRSASITPDLAEALRQLEVRAAEMGNVVVDFRGTSVTDHSWEDDASWVKETGCKPPWSLVPAGREVYLTIKFKEDQGPPESVRERQLATLWALAVPLRFVPWRRYPLPDEGDHVWHFFGPWQVLYEHLLGEGRGEEAWPSLCAAAQTDVGGWEGDRKVERFVQAQLHRVGVNIGPIDGRISDRSLEGLKRIGLQGMPIATAAERLAEMIDVDRSPEERRIGHVVVPGRDCSIVTSGQVYSTKTPQGAALTIDGPGRIIVDVN